MMKKIRTKVFWTRLSVATVLLILISTFSFGTFERVAEAQMLPLPTIASISPNVAEQGQTLELSISGMHFADGATLSFSPPTGITVTSVIVVNPMELRADIAIASDAPLDSRDVTVTNPDGHLGTLTGGFTVRAAVLLPPTISSIYPTSAEQGQTIDLTISGTHFIDGAKLSFSPPTGITATSVKFVSPMELKATIALARDAPVGPRDVTVTNPDGQSYTLEGGFTITEAKLTIDVIPPPAITGLTATNAHDGKVDFSWNPSTADDFQYYAIYIGETEITDVTGLSPITKITDIAVHTYQVTGLKDDTTYWFAVTVGDISGNENAMVTSVSATPTPSVVPAPRIGVTGIIVTPLQPKAGDTVTFTASIANTGTAPATDVTVNFKLDYEVVYGMAVDVPAGSSVAIDYSWQAEQGEHSIVVEATDASGATLATSSPYIMGVEAAGLPIGVIVVIVLASLAAIGGLVWRFLVKRPAIESGSSGKEVTSGSSAPKTTPTTPLPTTPPSKPTPLPPKPVPPSPPEPKHGPQEGALRSIWEGIKAFLEAVVDTLARVPLISGSKLARELRKTVPKIIETNQGKYDDWGEVTGEWGPENPYYHLRGVKHKTPPPKEPPPPSKEPTPPKVESGSSAPQPPPSKEPTPPKIESGSSTPQPPPSDTKIDQQSPPIGGTTPTK